MTSIEWTDVTDNPIRVDTGGHWCRKISSGCDNCYAERINKNPFFNGNKLRYEGKNPEMILDENMLLSWSRAKKPKRHFVGSMTDVFGEWVPDYFHAKMLDAMYKAGSNGQVFQILTKRPQIAAEAVFEFLKLRGFYSLPPNIWLGVSIENNFVMNKRSEQLSCIPCKRFWSLEPLLEKLENIQPFLEKHQIRWVIVGGESGHNSRPFCTDWARKIISECRAAKVAAFIKQFGSNPIEAVRNGKITDYKKLELISYKGGDCSEWSEDLQVREFPEGM